MFKKIKPAEFITIPKLAGRYKQVRVTFLGASFLKPSEGEQAMYADDDFALYIMDEVFKRQSILTRVKGIISKAHHCRKCDADLMGKNAHKRRFALNISYKEMPPFKLEIEMPAIPCRSCGTNNAVNESNTEIIICGAIAKAFESLKSKL